MFLPRLLFFLAISAALSACAQDGAGPHAPGVTVAGMTATEGLGLDLAQSDDADSENPFEERARQAFGVKPPARTDLPNRQLDSATLYKFLLAEIAVQRGDLQTAVRNYLDMARTTRDPRIAERATRLALYSRDNPAALEAARIWVATEKGSAAATQMLAALLIESKDLEAAKPVIQEMLKADGENAGKSLMQLPSLLSRYGDKNAALAMVRDLAKPYKQLPEAHFAVAQVAHAAGKHDAALAEIREAMRLRPAWEMGALLQAQILGRESRTKSLDYLGAFLAVYPDAQETRLNYARQLIAEKKFPEARAEFQRLLQDNPENADLAITVALLSVQMNDLDSAETQLKRVLDLNYKDPDSVRFHLGQISEERKRYDEAAKWYLSVEGGEQYVLAHARYAFMLARQGQLDQARSHLQNLEPQNQGQQVQILQSEAQLMREVKDYKESFAILKTALDAQPDHPELLYDVALAAEKLDRIDVAETSLRRLISLKPDHAQAYNALGYTLADRTDRLAEARNYIEKALQLAPEDPFILDSMGWVEYRLGNHAQGLQYLQRAYQQRPDPEIAAHLGEVLWSRGQKADAEKVWRDSLRDNPESEELQKTIKKFMP